MPRIFILFLALMTSTAWGTPRFDQTALEAVPIQANGRVKPLDTYARETVRFITGRETWGNKPALDTLMDWMTFPQKHEAEELILMDEPGLRELLGAPKENRRVSPEWLVKHEGFMPYAQDAWQKQENKAEINASQKEALQVVDRLQLFRDIRSGAALTVVPIPHGENGGWLSLSDLQMFPATQDKTGLPSPSQEALMAVSDMLSSWQENNLPGYAGATRHLKDILFRLGASHYPPGNKIRLEVVYNHAKPFQRVWILFLLAALLVGVSSVTGGRLSYVSGWVVYTAGLLVAISGFVLRVMISGRAPVTNMYESLVWVVFGASLFAIIFEAVYRNRVFALAGAITGVIGFVLADATTGVLDSGIHPLEPVLRSNFWLTIHVLTITLGYAAFLLSWMLGHWTLWNFWKHATDTGRIRRSNQWTYRAVQVGVILLAAGTLLGGVWANYSWGRFWGWDPKETWALIALLGYVAVLHGRLSGWLREFGFALWVMLAFLGVIMAWFGVNFVLGAGLHSYGFATQAAQWMWFVMAFIVLDGLLLGVMARVVHRRGGSI